MGQGLESLVRRLSRGIATIAAPLMLSSCATFYFGQERLPPDDLYDTGRRIEMKAPIARHDFSQDTLVLGQDAFDALPQERNVDITISTFPYYSRFFNSQGRWDRDFDLDGIYDWADPWPYEYGPYVDMDGNHVPSFADWEVGSFSNFHRYGYNSWNHHYGGMWGYNSWNYPFWQNDFWWGYGNGWGHDNWWGNHQQNYWYGGNHGGNWQGGSPGVKQPAYGRRDRPSTLTNTTIPTRRNPADKEQPNTTQPTRRVPTTNGSQLRTTDPSSRREYVPPTNNRTESKTGTQTTTPTRRSYTPSYNQSRPSERPLYNPSNTNRQQFENRKIETPSTNRSYTPPVNQNTQRRNESPASNNYRPPSRESMNNSYSPSRNSSSSGSNSTYTPSRSSSSSSGSSYESRSSSSSSSGSSGTSSGSSGSSSSSSGTSSSSGRRR